MESGIDLVPSNQRGQQVVQHQQIFSSRDKTIDRESFATRF
jgi:hypothetical protein